MSTRNRRFCFGLVGLITLAGVASFLFPQDLSLRSYGRDHRIRAERRDGQVFYRLRDVVNATRIRWEEGENRVSLAGPAGQIVLTEGSRLVRAEGPDVALSRPVRKEGRRGWLVPSDFMQNALPLVLEDRLERLGSDSYRLVSQRSTQVTVRLENYPPTHVRFVFEPLNATPAARVVETDQALLVEFEGRVLPQMPFKKPDPTIVAGLEFHPEGSSATFRLPKGPRYRRYNSFTLPAPAFRHVVDVFSSEGDIPTDARPFVVTIDPGHGGNDVGASTGSAAEIEEHALTLEIAERVKGLLEDTGRACKLTRTRNVPFSLDQRSAVANSFRTNAFVSLHLGKSTSPRPRGAVVYLHAKLRSGSVGVPDFIRNKSAPSRPSGTLKRWDEGQTPYLEQSRRLAESLQGELNRLYGVSNPVIELPLNVLAPVAAPAVLVEVGYLSNETDLEQLRSQEFRHGLAAAIARALEGFLNAPN